VTPADYKAYCITAPTTTPNGFSLPGGGGYPVCGLYDLSPTKFGQVSNLVTQASHYGDERYVNDFINLTVNGRLPRGIRLGGGVDTGRTQGGSVSGQMNSGAIWPNPERCFVVNSPQELLYCRVVTPFSAQTDVKVFGSVPLPGDIVVSGSFRNNSGPQILANYTAGKAEIASSLGRNLGACGAAVACSATVSGIPLIAPQTQWEPRTTQLDLRVAKIIKLGSKMRLQANVDLFNALNGSGILTINNTFGSAWRKPLTIVEARLVEFSAQLTF
jgi:hypothetical protein